MENKIIVSETDCAWTAGIIDGEGCIYVHKSKPSKGAINCCYSLRVRVGMTHMPTIKKLKTLWGGNYHEVRSKKKNCRNQAIWEISSNHAGIVLDRTAEYMVTKKSQAILALEFLKLPRAVEFNHTPDWLLKQREYFFYKIKSIKKEKYDVTYNKEIKLLKKDARTNCMICGITMPKFHSNGTERSLCSNKCKVKKMRVINESQEKMLYNDYLSGKYTYNELAYKFNVKEGTVGYIINRNKKLGLINDNPPKLV